MEIFKGCKIVGLCLLLDDILIISDIHVGQEESMHNSGILIPQNQFKQVMNSIENTVNTTKPKTIIINGDLKHEFGKITRKDWNQITELLSFLKKKSEVIIIKGNHDKVLEPLAKNSGIIIRDFFVHKNTYICHGDIIPKNNEFKKAKNIIIGHEHPAITLKDGARIEKYKCFLKGKYNEKILIVTPSFNPITEGTDVLKERLLSPFLKQNISKFEAFVIEDKVYYFGKIENIEKL